MSRTTTTTNKTAPALRVVLTLAALFSAALTHATERSVMHFDRISVSDGLSQSSALAIVQDETGFMWFATENGLDRYDGFSFTNYRHERGNPGALASDFARDVHLGADGSLWVATDGGGLSHWDATTDRFTTYRHDPENPDSIASDRIRTVTTDADGRVWIGTRGEGLDYFDTARGVFVHYTHDPDDTASLSHNDIYALTVGPDGSVWVGTHDGLNRLDPFKDQFHRYISDPDLPGSLQDNRIRSLLIDRDGTLWVGTLGGGLGRLDAETQQFSHFRHDPRDSASIASEYVDALFQDTDGRIWIGTDKGLSLWLADTARFMTFRNDPTDPSSIGGDRIFSIYQDRGGVLWFGTLTGGISRWNPRSWSFGHYKPDTSEGADFTSANITSFAEDENGNVWIGTFGGGINILNKQDKTAEALRHEDDGSGISDNRVMALTTDYRGHVWAGTMTAGLNDIDPDSGLVTIYRHDPTNPESLAADGIMSVLEAQDGAIWVGTFGGGVSRLDTDTGRFTNFLHDPENPNSLTSPRATSIAQSGDGTIWVGTDGGGLNWFDSETQKWSSLQHDPDDPQSLSANTIYDLHVDDQERVWIGTRSGLDLLVRPEDGSLAYRIIEISGDSGLARRAVYGIQSDSKDMLWVSTGNGLVSYDPSQGVVRNFHENQGLQGEEFNFGASFQDRSGMMYFGGSNGFNAFRPEELQFNTSPPPVVLTSVSIMNESLQSHRPYELLKRLDLAFTDYVVTFSVAALDFSAPEKNRFAYRLVGLDQEWVDLGNERRITYTNLHGGDYTLQVKAANSDGIWNQTGIAINLGVAYPPWKTWWAYCLYVLAVGLMVLAFWRHQQNKLRRESEYSRRLEQEVRDRTKQLNSRNADLKVVNAKLLEASTTDPLTGLRNRRYLFEQIGKDIDLVLRHYRDGTETLKPGGNNDLLFLMVDLDNFKPVNDSCGHEAGDELLIQIRDVLLEACRSSDDVIRWGGDEFLIVARETNREFAAELAERIRVSLSQRVFPLGNGQVARITTSIGYASYPFLKDRPELLSWEEVLGIADAAMYEAKAKRNSWTGLEGIGWSGSGLELCRNIKDSPDQMAEDGYVRTIESVDDVEEVCA